MRGALATIAVAAAACAGPPPVENPSPFDEDDPRAAPGPAEPERGETPSPDPEPEAPAPTPAAIAHTDLMAVLDRGPAFYRAAIGVEAVLIDGAFHGWAITRWDLPWTGLAAGDVVVDVNEVVLQRPDDLMALWELLRDASEVAIRVERDGAVEIRRFPVR